MLNQQTLNRPASFSGIGLHSGNRVNMTILPAPANSGVRFRRVDLDGKPEIEARVENVSETNRSTTLAKGNVKVHTVEHVLAALAGYGVDNAIVELDANEPPIADGSSREFCKIIQTAGIAPLDPLPADMAAFQTRIRAGPPSAEEPASETLVLDRPPISAIRGRLRLGIREMRVLGQEQDRALAAGLAEEITTALSRFRWISCVSGASLTAIAGVADDGEPLWTDLDMILDGTIQRGGTRLRITARLLDMRQGGEVVWANRFDRAGHDLLAIQDEVAASIVAQIDPVLLIREGENAAYRSLKTATPRDLVLRAVPAIYRLDRHSFQGAGDLLEEALRIDPNATEALAWYAYWHLFQVGQGWAADPDAATARAAVLADNAVAADPNDARALTLAGHVRGFLMRRPIEAAVLHERAISLNPNLAIAWCFSGFAFSYLGDQDTAVERMRQAIQLSPSDPHLFFFQAAIMMPHLLRGDFEAALEAGREAIELNPWFTSSLKGYLATLGHLGREREAAGIRSRLLKLEPGFTVADAIRRSPMTRPEDVACYAEGLRRGGLPEM